MSVTLFKYTSSGHEGMTDDEGMVHIKADAFTSFESLCGYCDTFMDQEEVSYDEPVTCAECASLYKAIKSQRKKITFNV